MLWLAIVGTSAHFMEQHMNKASYTQLVQEYHNDVKARNPEQSLSTAVDDKTVGNVAVYVESWLPHHSLKLLWHT